MSEQIHDGGPAFPVSTSDPRIGHQDGYGTWQFPGLSVRDYFAAAALQGWLSSYGPESSHPADIGEHQLNQVAVQAYDMADAMLAARDKK